MKEVHSSIGALSEKVARAAALCCLLLPLLLAGCTPGARRSRAEGTSSGMQSAASNAQDAARPAEPAFGLKLLDEAEYRSIPAALLPLSGELPARVDLSADMPPVQSQGAQQSCVGWSVAYAVRTYLARREQGWDVNSPAYQFSPAYVYNQLARGNCGSGVTFADALNLLTAEGAATMAAMPYDEADCRRQPDEGLRAQARAFRLAFYRRVNVQDPNEVKAQLAAGFPVLVALVTDGNFTGLGRDQVWRERGATAGFHAVALVGYDDAARAFRLINSWGRGWGTDGYGWVDYDLFRQVTREGYVAVAFRSQAATVVTPTPLSTPQTYATPYATPYVQPTPQVVTPLAREARIQIVGVEHNVNAGTQSAGMNIRLQYTLRGFAGNTGQIALHFWYPNAQPVGAALAAYRDIYNNAAAGTPVFSIPGNDYSNYAFALFVPYAALNVPTGGYVWNGATQTYQYRRTDLTVVADLFVNNFGVAQSVAVPFYVNR
jgi:hypothetical protein